MDLALAIRLRVFVEEQGVPLGEEIDDHDRTDAGAVHVIAFEGGAPVGTGRFYPLGDGAVQIGRMAVVPEARNRGVGTALLRALIDEARRQGHATGHLLAQLTAIPLYERAGFRVSDAAAVPVLDGGILHQPMEGPLS